MAKPEDHQDERQDGRRRRMGGRRRDERPTDEGLEDIVAVRVSTNLDVVDEFVELHEEYLLALESLLPGRSTRTFEHMQRWGALRRRADDFERRIVRAFKAYEKAHGPARALQDDFEPIAAAAEEGVQFLQHQLDLVALLERGQRPKPGPKPRPETHAVRMLAVLRAASRPITLSEAQRAAGMKFPTARAALRQLESEGKAKTSGTGKRQLWSAI